MVSNFDLKFKKPTVKVEKKPAKSTGKEPMAGSIKFASQAEPKKVKDNTKYFEPMKAPLVKEAPKMFAPKTLEKPKKLSEPMGQDIKPIAKPIYEKPKVEPIAFHEPMDSHSILTIPKVERSITRKPTVSSVEPMGQKIKKEAPKELPKRDIFANAKVVSWDAAHEAKNRWVEGAKTEKKEAPEDNVGDKIKKDREGRWQR